MIRAALFLITIGAALALWINVLRRGTPTTIAFVALWTLIIVLAYVEPTDNDDLAPKLATEVEAK